MAMVSRAGRARTSQTGMNSTDQDCLTTSYRLGELQEDVPLVKARYSGREGKQARKAGGESALQACVWHDCWLPTCLVKRTIMQLDFHFNLTLPDTQRRLVWKVGSKTQQTENMRQKSKVEDNWEEVMKMRMISGLLATISYNISWQRARIRGKLESRNKMRIEINRDPSNPCRNWGTSWWWQLCTATEESVGDRPFLFQMMSCIDHTYEWKTRQETTRKQKSQFVLSVITEASVCIDFC